MKRWFSTSCRCYSSFSAKAGIQGCKARSGLPCLKPGAGFGLPACAVGRAHFHGNLGAAEEVGHLPLRPWGRRGLG